MKLLLFVLSLLMPVQYPATPPIFLPEMPVLVAIRAQDDAGQRMRKQDPQSFCFNPATSGTQAEARDRNPHAHRCFCHLICQTYNGDVTGDHEDKTCTHYCVREACACHVEEPCEMSPQGAH